ncbi:methyltransferase domain-containing protein [Mycolicibacterium litorale]|uniref:methyltransferase domain-containing protein n=1 Tax=Mycolicibacterium litorale TaxID=758802 RepID=UPI003CFADE84
MTDDESTPLSKRSDADVPGHWLPGRLGRRVLRPGGLALTTRVLAAAEITGADVVELGPGPGRTAHDILVLAPRSYVGADASATGLPDNSADVVVGEAILTTQSEKAKKAVLDEAFRILRPGGRYAVHELGLTPDTLGDDTKDAIRRDLARAVKVDARPLTVREWTELLTAAGFQVSGVDRAPPALLQPARVVAAEGVVGVLRIVGDLILRGAARQRVLSMERTFTECRDHLTAVGVIAVKPSTVAP